MPRIPAIRPPRTLSASPWVALVAFALSTVWATAQTVYNADTSISGTVNLSGDYIVTNGATLTAGSGGFLNAAGYKGYIGGNAVTAGTGTLLVENGGAASNNDGFLGYLSTGNGTATVTGAGSTWTNNGNLDLGRSGTGALTVSAGGAVANSQAFLGFNASGTATVLVDGNSSTWTNSTALNLGVSGTGAVTVSNGGAVSNTDGILGFFSTGNGTAAVTGAGSTWTNSTGLYVGKSGTGILTVSASGKVNVNTGSGTLVIAQNSGSNGTLNIGASVGDAATTAGLINAATVQGGDGTATLQFNTSGTSYFTKDGTAGGTGINTSGALALIITAGTATFTGNLAHTSASTVNGGTMLVNGTHDAAITVNSGATLGGTGTIGGITMINGTLSPGNSPGVLAFTNDLTLAGTTLMEISGPVRGTDYDGIDFSGTTLTYGGALELSFGATATAGTYDLFNLTSGISAASFTAVALTGDYTASLSNSAGLWTGSAGGFDFAFTQSTGDLIISAAAIPEPSTYAALAGAAALGLAFLRRRHFARPA